MSRIRITVAQAKEEARALRARRAEAGTAISHSRALEEVARAHGARDWNTFVALAPARPLVRIETDAVVAGHYLGQPFTARVVDCMPEGAGYRVELALEAPVDVVRSSLFSSWRRRVRAVIGADGRSAETTSDGAPQLVIEGYVP